MLPDISDIKKRRVNLGFTQKKLALVCGISQSIIAKIESNKINPSYSVIRKIFEILDSLEKKEELKAKDVMSKNVIHARISDEVSKISKLMTDKGFSQLPVFDRNHCVGSISEKTILDKAVSVGSISEVYKKKVKEIMDEPFPTVNKETPLQTLISLLSHNSAILISDMDKIVGIVTKADLLKLPNSLNKKSLSI